MSHLINLFTTPYSYNKDTKVFSFSEKDVPFASTYEVLNPQTGNKVSFDLSHSTGPEFHPDTKWVYKNKQSDVTVEVCNDALITKLRGLAYLDHKLHREERYADKHGIKQ